MPDLLLQLINSVLRFSYNIYVNISEEYNFVTNNLMKFDCNVNMVMPAPGGGLGIS